MVKKNINCLLITFWALCFTQLSFSHGYISAPQSRSYKCNLGQNIGCGPVQYEPQSVEGPDGFPDAGPADANIASAGLPQFSQLNEQTKSRWIKTKIKPGGNQFSWRFTANHVTKNWNYYLTKPDWNPNKPLTRASFDTEPFCSIEVHGLKPPKEVTHHCIVPADRSGYHVILGTWDVADTPATFYQVIDVDIINDNDNDDNSDKTLVSNLNKVGTINATVDLNPGDIIQTRVFNADGENLSLSDKLTINSSHEGDSKMWPYLLAKTINASDQGLIAGVKDSKGNITPVYDTNFIYTKPDSGIEDVEIQITELPVVTQAKLVGLELEYQIEDGKVKLDFMAKTSAKYSITVKLVNPNGKEVDYQSITINNDHASLSLADNNAIEGQYNIIFVAKPEHGNLIQKTYTVDVSKENTNMQYDFIFPESLSSYSANTKVFHNKTGKVYECRPFPYSGYCKQWSKSATQFEPGVGSDWKTAWFEL